MNKEILLYEYQYNKLQKENTLRTDNGIIYKVNKMYFFNGEQIFVKLNVEHHYKISKLENELLKNYATKIRKCIKIFEQNPILVKKEYSRYGGVNTLLKELLFRKYKENDINMHDNFYNVIDYNTDYNCLMIRHYWCGAEMYVWEDEINYDAGSSGACDPRECLEESKERFIKEFKTCFDIFYNVVMQFKSK